MDSKRYRKTPMHAVIREGERVRRIDVVTVPSLLNKRQGTVAGPAVEKGRAVWYVPVLWDGSTRPEHVHVSRLLRLENDG